MRIAYVTTDPGIPVFGCKGASIHVQEMLRAFIAQGAEIVLISPRTRGTPPPTEMGRTCMTAGEAGLNPTGLDPNGVIACLGRWALCIHVREPTRARRTPATSAGLGPG